MTEFQFSPYATLFLLVEDDGLVAASYRRALGRHGAVTVASNVAEANVAMDTMDLTGIVADVSLPDGTGFDVATRVRTRTPHLPILLISGAVDGHRLGAAHELGASFLLKPVDAMHLTRFAERAIGRRRRAATLLGEWVSRYRLTAAETVTLRLALNGRQRAEIAAARGVTAITVRNQIASLVAKGETRSLADMVANFYRELWSMDC